MIWRVSSFLPALPSLPLPKPCVRHSRLQNRRLGLGWAQSETLWNLRPRSLPVVSHCAFEEDALCEQTQRRVDSTSSWISTSSLTGQKHRPERRWSNIAVHGMLYCGEILPSLSCLRGNSRTDIQIRIVWKHKVNNGA